MIVVSAVSAWTAFNTTNPVIAQYSWAAAISSFAALPYTGFVVKPVNDALLGLKDLTDQRELSITEEKEVDRLIEKWNVRHLPRLPLLAVAWGSSLVAFAVGVYGVKVHG